MSAVVTCFGVGRELTGCNNRIGGQIAVHAILHCGEDGKHVLCESCVDLCERTVSCFKCEVAMKKQLIVYRGKSVWKYTGESKKTTSISHILKLAEKAAGRSAATFISKPLPAATFISKPLPAATFISKPLPVGLKSILKKKRVRFRNDV